MPDGSVVRPRLTLALEGGTWVGKTRFSPWSEGPITNTIVTANQLRFQVIRRRDGREVTTTYSGTWDATAIRGTIESNWAGPTESFNWEARRAHQGVEGTWSWTNSLSSLPGGGNRGGGRGGGTRVELDQEGDRITGKTLSRFGRPTRVTHGSITNGEVYFEIERTSGDSHTVTRYRGKQSGDVILGRMELESDEDQREGPWEARRTD